MGSFKFRLFSSARLFILKQFREIVQKFQKDFNHERA